MLREMLVDFAKLCSLSYLGQEKIIEDFQNCKDYSLTENQSVFQKCETQPVLYSSEEDCQVYVCEYQKYFCISYRGTESFQDVLTDLKISKVPFPLYRHNIWEAPDVHRGFSRQFESIREPLDLEIEKYLSNFQSGSNSRDKPKVVFTGHSLGGALATLSALYFQCKYPDVGISCITFGSPRVGDAQFAKLFNEKVRISYRYVNDNDPVPCIPTSWRFQHVKGLVWLNQDKIMNEIKVWRFYRFCKNTVASWFGYGYNALEDHSCNEYIKDCEKCLDESC